MADLNKLTKLEALKQLAERVNKDFSTKTEVKTLETRVETLETTGGEKNKIEKIKVNDVDQPISEDDKSVNITVPKKVTELEDAENYATIDQVNSKISSVYKPGGSTTFEELVTASKDNLGTVYNITNKFTTDERFIEGEGNSYPKGTNVVVIDAGTEEYKYDVLAGFVDLTEYAKTNDVVAKEEGKGLSKNDYTDEDKQKLQDLKNYTHPESPAGVKESGLYKVKTDENGHIVEATLAEKADITQLGIPEENTTYSEATIEEAGLMSSTDKQKLDGMNIASEEEVTGMLEEVFGAE